MADASIQVAVRIRPFSARETAALAPVDTSQPFLGDGGLAGSPSKTPASGGAAASRKHVRNIVTPVDDKVLVFDPEDAQPRSGAAAPDSSSSRLFASAGGGARRPRDVRYAFDRVFPPSAGQRAVFSSTVEPMLGGVLDGYNASVFAYGVRAFCSLRLTLRRPGVARHTRSAGRRRTRGSSF